MFLAVIYSLLGFGCSTFDGNKFRVVPILLETVKRDEDNKALMDFPGGPIISAR